MSTTQQAPAPGTPEYNQQMATAFENQSIGTPASPAVPAQAAATPAAAATKPEGVPDKFWNADKGTVDYAAWNKSYNELYTKAVPQSQQGAAQTPAASTEGQSNGDPGQAAAQAAGLDWDGLTAKVHSTGTIEDTDFAALEKIGIPREIAEDYIATANFARTEALNRTAQFVGGKEVLDGILNAAAEQLSDSEKKYFNEQLAHPDKWQVAMKQLKDRFAPGDGEPESQIFGANVPGGTVTPYASRDQYLEDMRATNSAGQKKYEVDPAFRDQVRRRLIASDF